MKNYFPLISFLLLLCVGVTLANSEDKLQSKSHLRKPYLLLVCSSYENQMDKLDLNKIEAINESPYNGVAVRVIWEFDGNPFKFDVLEKIAHSIKKVARKEIWPWVFLNRMVGSDEKDNIPAVIKDKPYFLQIKGMDIYDEAKALTDFLNVWRMSLRLAKKLSSPGIVFDMEPYNNSNVYKIKYLAGKYKKSSDDIKTQLKFIGAKLTQIVAEEYPEAIIWFLFTYMGDSSPKLNPFGEEEFQSVSYIAEGMINEAEERNISIKFIDGGEVGLGYCYKSLEDLNQQIKKRQEQFKFTLSRHPKLLLGGTIAPWSDVEDKQGWMMKGICGKSEFKTMDDFAPLIRSLSENYDYIWIYATHMAGYNPFDKKVAEKFNKGLKKSFQH